MPVTFLRVLIVGGAIAVVVGYVVAERRMIDGAIIALCCASLVWVGTSRKGR